MSDNESGVADVVEEPDATTDDVASVSGVPEQVVTNVTEPQVPQVPPPQLKLPTPSLGTNSIPLLAKSNMPPTSGNSSTEQLVKTIVQSLQEIGLEEMDVREIMQLVKIKVKKLRYSILLPGEDRK